MDADTFSSMLSEKYRILRHRLNEKALRLCAAADARTLGRGGIVAVAKACKLSRNTIYAGIHELETGNRAQFDTTESSRIRKVGGGRKQLIASNPRLLVALDQMVDPVTRGDPMSPLRWTGKSTTKLAEQLCQKGYRVSQRTVWNLLDELGYSMQSNRKRFEGADHPDRNAQFQFIADKVQDFIHRGQPVISVDTKKKELVGDFKNCGKEWEKKGCPKEVKMHDFADPALGKAIPYGVYDIANNKGWVSVGITHDTAEFAVTTIFTWWQSMGWKAHPHARELLITADGEGRNGWRVRLWKVELQKLANRLNKTIHVCHFPPGTSKWNKIEHRMFCHITENWRARPLESRAVVVNLIANTTTKKGLKIEATLDENEYETGKKVTDKQMVTLAIEVCKFHGEWNYKIKVNSS
ncbi:MAG: ISAzo13 family transposase [Planctomycetota bacterium]|nr:ISAzo13 family transposase [Planctomycetota bacterium]MDE1890765.1 ISAzo13 family transposase [Planctomycetota bacterium]MDE2217794.1 ISAzo13 family transposase [Planctomycetota bacterium]